MFRHIVRSVVVVATSLSIAAPATSAQAAELTGAEAKKFFNDHHCNACHEADEERIGPSYRIVARKYADASPDTVDKLSKKIIFGGAGNWGVAPMISYPNLSPEQARRIARWILELNQGKPK